MDEDIKERVQRDFPPAQVEEAITLLEESGRSSSRIIRCVVVASEGNLGKLRHYLDMAEEDSRDVIDVGEQDPEFPNRRLRDLRVSFLIDSPEKFWIGYIADTLYKRGYVLAVLDSRRASPGPVYHLDDESEGVAHFVGDPFPVTIQKAGGQWRLLGSPDDAFLYYLDRPFGDETAFLDALSSFILAKQRPHKRVQAADVSSIP